MPSFALHAQLPDEAGMVPKRPQAVAIGMFDGVHVGHRQVLHSAYQQAASQGYGPAVLTFSNHPQTLLSQTPPRQLSTLEERLAIFKQVGMQAVWAVPFDETFREISAYDFVNDLLARQLQVKHVSVGYDFCFGNGREGNGDVLKHLCADAGITVDVVEPVRAGGQIASSTLIRKLLTFGAVEEAATLLARPYSVSAPVITGRKQGRTLGFPTANVDMTALTHRALPGIGTYAGWACLNGQVYLAVCNIGLAPTFGHSLNEQMEIHMLDYSGPEFYGETIAFAFTHRLRNEQKFESKAALVEQITADCDQARQRLNQRPAMVDAFPVMEADLPVAGLPA